MIKNCDREPDIKLSDIQYFKKDVLSRDSAIFCRYRKIVILTYGFYAPVSILLCFLTNTGLTSAGGRTLSWAKEGAKRRPESKDFASRSKDEPCSQQLPQPTPFHQKIRLLKGLSLVVFYPAWGDLRSVIKPGNTPSNESIASVRRIVLGFYIICTS